jgi:molecular chaperone DnaJ
MAKRDYYEILGVDRNASEQDLKSAFRRLAKEHHPDRNPGNKSAEQKFKEINEAYEALKDPQKRAAYDRFGHAAFEGGMGGRGPGGAGGFGPDFASSMSDIFDDLFGEFMGGRRGSAQRGRSGRERGADVRYNMEISLQEAYAGKNAQIRVPTSVTCETCSGTGAKAGTKPVSCHTCGGMGKIRASQGFFTIERTCPSCQGRGEVIEDPCPGCSGAGRVTKERTLSVNIPAGVEDGTRIRLAGEGEAGLRGGPPGDLYIFLSIKPHPFFQRDGADIFCKVPISMTTAALGGQVDVPTLEGTPTRVRIPEGTESGKQFRLKGKGMPVLRTKSTGDMYIQVDVETPKNLSRRQRELLEEFERESHRETSPESHGFFSKVKDFFEGKGS